LKTRTDSEQTQESQLGAGMYYNYKANMEGQKNLSSINLGEDISLRNM
jgi:hypothetical protein